MPPQPARTRQQPATPQPRIQSLARANAILDVVLHASGQAARLGQISAALGLNKTTVYNLAESLVALGFLARDDSGQGYVLGLRNLELGRATSRRNDLIELARPALLRLCRASAETVNLAAPHVNSAMIVESYEGAHGVRATSYAGTRAPYHCTACGKALLAAFTPATRAEIYAAAGLAAATAYTITDIGLLEADVAETQRRGFALEREENEIGASCVAMPVRDAFDQPMASISIAGVVQRMTPDFVSRLVQHLAEEVALLEASLGRRPQA